MSIYRKILVIGLIGLCFNSFAQQDEKMSQSEKDQHELSDEKKEKMADKLMLEGSYYSAVEYYNEVWLNDTSRYDLKYKMGLSYYFSRDYVKAEPWFERAVKLDPKAPTLAFYYYGECLRHNMKYEEAKKQYIAFRKVRYKGADSKTKKKLNAQHAKACDFAIEGIKRPMNAEVINLGDKVNSNYTDFSPWLTSDSTLIYASLRSDTVLHAHAHTTEFFPVHLFETKKNGEVWDEPEELDRKFNKHFSHSANAIYSKDGKTMYFTECKPIHDYVKCHIFTSVFAENEWSKPRKLHDKINSAKFTSTQPAIGYYMKKVKRNMVEVPVLYFVSDRTGTKGGMDIWYSEKSGDKGKFKSPKNCGTRVNTPGDDISPFYNHKEGTMYFSSNYHLGYGGYDVFKVEGKTKSWQKAENVGYVLNSSLDDTYFTTDSTGLEGFMVSNRPGGHALTSETCCDDIYSHSLMPEVPHQLDGFVYDTTLEKPAPLMDADVSLYIVLEDGTDSLIKIEHTSPEHQRYSFVVSPNQEYYFKGSKAGYESEHFKFNTSDMADEDTLHINYPIWPKIDPPIDTIKEEPKDTIVKTVEEPIIVKNEAGFILKNVLHDFDIAAHSSGTGINIDDVIKVLKENPYMIISIESHTDSKGSEEYNIVLSKKRATSARSYLIRKGISGTRLKVKYFGESKPAFPNENPDGSDNEEGRAKNRRTEFKVVSNKKF